MAKASKNAPKDPTADLGSTAKRFGSVAKKALYDAKAKFGKGYSFLEQETIAIGSQKLTVYRRGDQLRPRDGDLGKAVAAGSWYVRFRVPGHNNYYKVSLKTSSYREAKASAVDRFLEMKAELAKGHKIQSLNLAELFRQYGRHLEESVRRGLKRASTLKNVNTRLGHGKRFLQAKLPNQLNTKVGVFDGNLFNDYLTWREAEVRGKTKSQASLSMIRDELIHIRSAFRWAYEKRLAPEKSIPRWDTFKTPEPKRERVTFEQYNQVVRILLSWASRKQEDSERDAYYKEMVRHGFLVISNCGLRSGELFGLKYKDLTIDSEKNFVTIRVRSETSKKGKDRNTTISARSVDGKLPPVNYLIRWINDYAIHKKAEDFVFALYEDGQQRSKIYPAHSAARERFYQQYKNGFRKMLAKANLEFFDLYHCRHIYISYRLLDEKNPYMVAKAVGTSVGQIEKTYDQIQAELASRQIQQGMDSHGAQGTREKKVTGESKTRLKSYPSDKSIDD
jgi:integrase